MLVQWFLWAIAAEQACVDQREDCGFIWNLRRHENLVAAFHPRRNFSSAIFSRKSKDLIPRGHRKENYKMNCNQYAERSLVTIVNRRFVPNRREKGNVKR